MCVKKIKTAQPTTTATITIGTNYIGNNNEINEIHSNQAYHSVDDTLINQKLENCSLFILILFVF